jgi:hypothetical protein
MDTKGWGNMTFGRHFFFIGGRYQGVAVPALGYATRLGNFYLGAYFRGTVVQGINTTHNDPLDSNWDPDGNGSSSFSLNDSVAVLFGAPNIGGFRLDWIAVDTDGTNGPTFEKFKGDNTKTYNSQNITNAEGKTAESMSFVLNYGNTFAGKYKVDAALGFSTSDTVNVTGGQVGASVFKYTSSENSKFYFKAGGGYILNDTSSVDADYSLIIMPGAKWEQTLGSVTTSETHNGNEQNIINIGYSKTFNWDDKITMNVKPGIKFDILSEEDVYETNSGSVDKGSQTTLNIVPSVAMGLRYKAAEKLTFYTGTTITLFDAVIKKGEKGSDGATYNEGSSSDIIAGTEAGFDIGCSLALTNTLNLDFNARQLIAGVFQNHPIMDIYLTFKK